jgi:hypothetical protein
MRWKCDEDGETRNEYRILVEKPLGKQQLGRPRMRWEYITVEFRETGYEDRRWM